MLAVGRIDLAAVHRHYHPLPKGLFQNSFILKLFRESAAGGTHQGTPDGASLPEPLPQGIWLLAAAPGRVVSAE